MQKLVDVGEENFGSIKCKKLFPRLGYPVERDVLELKAP